MSTKLLIDNQTKTFCIRKRAKEGIGKSCARWSNVYRACRALYIRNICVLILFSMKNVCFHEVFVFFVICDGNCPAACEKISHHGVNSIRTAVFVNFCDTNTCFPLFVLRLAIAPWKRCLRRIRLLTHISCLFRLPIGVIALSGSTQRKKKSKRRDFVRRIRCG